MTVRKGSRRRTTGRRSESGAAAVEFALVLPMVMVLLLGMLEYGWYFYTAQSVSSAAREVTRRLVVGDCQATGQAQLFARSQLGLEGLTVTFGPLADPDANAAPAVGQVLRVEVADATGGVLLDLVPLPNGGEVTRSVEALVEDNVPGASC